MPDLSSEQKTLIVVRLACYASAPEIIAELKERFDGLTVKPQQIGYYDPLTAQGSAELDKQWKDLFWKTRNAYDKSLARVPIANQNYRLMLLNRIASDPVTGKGKLGLKALEQAAKEVGGLYKPSGSAPDVDEQIERVVAELVSPRQAKTAEAPEG